MAKYRLIIKDSVTKDLRKIPNQDVKRILERIYSLIENPRPKGCEKLTSQERYRIRQGVYRILYEITDNHLIITIVKVGHRKEVYNDK